MKGVCIRFQNYSKLCLKYKGCVTLCTALHRPA
jgi:hypothetical protein